jgi:hypothetical protein
MGIEVRRTKVVTDEDVEREIERLKESELVKLAKAEERKKYRRRQYMYQLRSYERRGLELAREGITMELLESDYEEGEE